MSKNVLKIAVIGQEYVGKTALCNAITDRTIDNEYNCTIGVDFMVKYVFKDNQRIRLSLWDLAGAKRFTSIVSPYIKNTPLLIFCYSAESLQSFNEMTRRHNIYKIGNMLKNKHIIIIATKTDSDKIDINYENWGLTYAKQHKIPFIKTSAYSKEGIPELIQECIKHIEKFSLLQIKNKLKESRVKLYCCLF
jgi:Rho family, other